MPSFWADTGACRMTRGTTCWAALCRLAVLVLAVATMALASGVANAATLSSTSGDATSTASAETPVGTTAGTTVPMNAVANAIVDGPGVNLAAGPWLRAHGQPRVHQGSLRHVTGPADLRDFFCTTYGGRLGAFQPARETPVGGVAWNRAAWVVNNATIRNPLDAAVVYSAVNYLVSVPFRSDWPTYVSQFSRLGGAWAAVPRRVTATVNAAAAYAGPYVVAAKVSAPVLYGGTTTAVATLKARSGRGVAGVPVDFGFVGASGSGSAGTNLSGQAGKLLKRTTTGTVTVTATAHPLNSESLTVSSPPTGYQRLVAASAQRRSSRTARFTYNSAPGRPSWSYSCSNTCNGHPPIVYAGVNAGAAVLRVNLHVRQANGSNPAVSHLDIQPGHTAKHAPAAIPDTVRISFGYQYALPGGTWTAEVMWSGQAVIDCPASPPVDVHVTCVCVGSKLQVTVYAANNPAAILVNGHKVAVARPHTSATVPIVFTTAPISIGVAVQRLHGDWLPFSLLTVTPSPHAGSAQGVAAAKRLLEAVRRYESTR